MTTFNTDILDNLIVGRIEPHIYAFTTNTVPNYLKVGDTYRPVNVRLDEWRDYFPNLEHESDWEWLAKTESGKYFRDFAIHYYLEIIKRYHRLQPTDFDGLPYYSREFFENATPKDIDEAIQDIEQYAIQTDGSRQYQFYNEERLPEETHFAPTEKYDPRPNQENTIQRFVAARKRKRKNLLMYAVMRFGKSFTSMCCATEMDVKVVLVVSAKADVKNEWKKTVESHVRFADYCFLCSDNLREDKAISKKLEEGKRVVVFLTLQDLMGDDIKKKHKDLFCQRIDLLIVDETHFGARAEEYGKVLRNVNNLKPEQISKEQEKSGESTFDDLEKGLERIKALKVDTTLHLSGTPYRILMGSEFKKEDIVAFYQFTDIIDDKEEWDSQHKEDIEQENINPDTQKPYQDWDNPYYGFPQMIRFAFNPSESARTLIEQLKNDGKTTQLNELLRPQSISKDTTSEKKHRLFVHEKEVLDLLRVIDGSAEDENLLGFLDYDKLKEGKMCRHIVMVLPFCASCDAMEKLIGDHKDEFKNLDEYTLVNIAGHESNFDTTEEIKHHIKQLESDGKKTITLTVNRMLTGSTVREWDTMIFLKDVSSPQEYDQAIFRLQNQYVTTYKDESGNTIKYNMKPQTLLVDFDPNRMFFMQEQKSKIYNVNTNERGNDELETRLKRELEISPIIVINKGKISQVTPTNIMDAVRDYSANRTVMDEATAVPTDFKLLEDPNMLDIIKNLDPIDNKKGINIKPNEGSGDDYDNSDDDDEKGTSGGDKPAKGSTKNDEDKDDRLEKRLATFFAQILFYALLTDDSVKSLNEVIQSSKRNKNNKRIMRNVGLETDQLKYLQKHINPFVLSDLDYKINNINDLLSDTTHEPLVRVERALKKFGRLSTSEIVTPAKVAEDMVALLPEENINNKTRFLDIASKQGEFACALYKRFGPAIKENIYALPTSSLTYEFTYKVFKLLEIPAKNIIADFNTYDLIGEDKETHIQTLKNMHFDITIGNPPYNVVNKGDGTGADPIYHKFIDVARSVSPEGSFIHPGRFLFNAGKTPKEWNETMLNDEHFELFKYWPKSDDVFPDSVDIKGGIAITHWNKQQLFTPIGFFSLYNEIRTILQKVKAKDFEPLSELVYPRDLYRLTQVVYDENSWAEGRQSKGHKYDVGSNVFDVLPELFFDEKPNDDNQYCRVFGRRDNNRIVKWIKREYLRCPDNVDSYKVFVTKTNGTGTLGEALSMPIIGEPNMGHTVTFLSIGKFDTEEDANALLKYIKTKFARLLLGTLKVTQDNPKETWGNIPIQDFTSSSDIDWSKSIPEIDAQLYKKYGLSDEEIRFIESMIKAME